MTRTVTFSEAETARLVSSKFEPSWANRNPKFFNPEQMTERVIAVRKGEGFATRNIATYVLDPEGRCLHVIRGHLAPIHYRAELEFSLKVLEATRGPDGLAAFARLHRERSESRQALVGELRKLRPEVPEGFAAEVQRLLDLFPTRNGESSDGGRSFGFGGGGGREGVTGGENLKALLRDRRDHLAECMQVQARISRWMWKKSAKGLPTFEAARKTDNGANPFAEE